MTQTNLNTHIELFRIKNFRFLLISGASYATICSVLLSIGDCPSYTTESVLYKNTNSTYYAVGNLVVYKNGSIRGYYISKTKYDAGYSQDELHSNDTVMSIAIWSII